MPVVGDIYHVEERIRQVYPDYFLSGEPGCYAVKRMAPTLVRGLGFTYAVDKPQTLLAWREMTLDARLLHHLRYTDAWSNQRDILREIEEAEDAQERANERRADDLVHHTAKEMQRAIEHDLGLR